MNFSWKRAITTVIIVASMMFIIPVLGVSLVAYLINSLGPAIAGFIIVGFLLGVLLIVIFFVEGFAE